MYHLERYNSIAYWKIAGETGDYEGGTPVPCHCRRVFVEWQLPECWAATAGVCSGWAQPCPSPEQHPRSSPALPEPGFVCAPLESTAPIQELGEARGDVQHTTTGARSHAHHFSVLSAENSYLFCAHWAQLYIIRAQKLFGCFRAAGCLHRWRTGYGDCGLSAAGDFCGLWSEANSSRESQNACNSSTVCHPRRFPNGKREEDWMAAQLSAHAPTQTGIHTLCMCENKARVLAKGEITNWPALSISTAHGGLDKLSWASAETEDIHSQNLPPL